MFLLDCSNANNGRTPPEQDKIEDVETDNDGYGQPIGTDDDRREGRLVQASLDDEPLPDGTDDHGQEHVDDVWLFLRWYVDFCGDFITLTPVE